MPLEISFDTRNVCLQSSELFRLRQRAGKHALGRRAPVGDSSFIARKPCPEATVVHRAPHAALEAWARLMTASWGRLRYQRFHIDAVIPSVFNIANTSNQGLLRQASRPIVGGTNPLLHNICGSALEKMDCTVGERQGKHMWS